MLLFAAASAPESVGGSLAALAIYDLVRFRVPKTYAVTGDPLGILYRTFAHRDPDNAPIAPQPPAGVPVLSSLEDVPVWGRDHGADALVFDATGDLARDVRAWPDQLAHLVRPPTIGVLFVMTNTSRGANAWIDDLARDHPETFRATVVLSYPIGRQNENNFAPERHTIPAPTLSGGAFRRLDQSGLPPTTLRNWTGPERNRSELGQIAAWLDAWTALIDPLFPPAITSTQRETPA